MKKIHVFLLGLIIVLAFFLRFYRVSEVPPSLNWDEVSIGYNAYSILKTGHDEWGQFMPLNFKSYGEYKLPVQIYATVPTVAIFGLNEWGVRMLPVLYGTLTVLIAFFLGQKIFKNSKIGLITAFLLAISPWHIQLTRASFEASFSAFWISLGVLFLLKGFEKQKYWIFSVIFFAISVYTYNSARVFTPLFLFAILLIYRKEILKHFKVFLVAMLIFVAMLAPLVPALISGDAKARYKLVSITDEAGLIPRIEENRNHSKLPKPLPRLVHNRVTYISLTFTEHYLAHFTPQFLFLSGAPHKQHHVQGMGELYLFEAPFLLLGLFLLFRQKQKYRWLLVVWLMLAYIPVSVTNDSIPHALRTVIVLPTYQLITALGIYSCFVYLKNKRKNLFAPAAALSAVVLLVSVGYYLYRYYVIYPMQYSYDWQYGYKQVVSYIQENQDKYDEIVFSRHYGEPHMFTLFYLNYDPAKYQNNPNLDRFETHDWVRVLRFDKFYFPDLGDKGTQFADIVAQNPGKHLLFIGKPDDFPADYPRLEKIRFLNGTGVFDIVEAGTVYANNSQTTKTALDIKSDSIVLPGN